MEKINILERIKEFGLDWPPMVDTKTGEFSYSFINGYESLTYKESKDFGSISYSGAYHPNNSCKGDGICKWCGRTLFDE